jgi:hypothetical protein
MLMPDQDCEPGRQHESVPVDGEAGGLAIVDHVVFGELGDAADQHPEQQHEGPRDPQVQWDGLVGEAPTELMDVVTQRAALPTGSR